MSKTTMKAYDLSTEVIPVSDKSKEELDRMFDGIEWRTTSQMRRELLRVMPQMRPGDYTYVRVSLPESVKLLPEEGQDEAIKSAINVARNHIAACASDARVNWPKLVGNGNGNGNSRTYARRAYRTVVSKADAEEVVIILRRESVIV